MPHGTVSVAATRSPAILRHHVRTENARRERLAHARTARARDPAAGGSVAVSRCARSRCGARVVAAFTERGLIADAGAKWQDAPRPPGAGSCSRSLAIGGVTRGNKHLVVQGLDDGHGWSLALEEDTGTMTASAIGDEEGMMIFGACTQP